MEFETDINRNIELNGILITQPPKEPVDITPRCSLGYSNLKDISDSHMLSGNVVNVFQKMMEKQFPEANALQDPILGQTLSFKVQKNKPFVQVLHDGKLNWIAISGYGCNEDEVCYIYSLFRARIADHTKQQICAILNCDLKHVKIKVFSVQQQSNGVDCGVFALAFCFHILSEKADPVGIFWIRIFFFCIFSLRLKVHKFTGVHPVYSRAHSLHVHSTTVTKMKSLKWFYLQLIYTFFYKQKFKKLPENL